MKHLAILILPMILSQAGCTTSPPSGGGAAPQVPPLAATSPSPAELPGVYLVNLQVVLMEMPVGSCSGSEEMWSFLDEEPANAALGAVLGRNGVRIGTAPHSCLGDLERVLKRLAGQKASVMNHIATPGSTLQLPIKDHQGEQTIFTFYGDRTFSGRDYPPGTNLLMLTCTPTEDDPNRLVITGQPQVRAADATASFVEKNSKFVIRTKSDVFNFPPLLFRLSVRSQDLIVIGPGIESRRGSSVGHSFLVTQREGMEFETVVILLPTVTRATAGPGAVSRMPPS